MPRITLKNADQLRKQHPREYTLLFQLGGSADGIEKQARTRSTAQRALLPSVRNALTLPAGAMHSRRRCWTEPRSTVQKLVGDAGRSTTGSTARGRLILRSRQCSSSSSSTAVMATAAHALQND